MVKTMVRDWFRSLLAAALVTQSFACATPTRNRAWVADELTRRSGFKLRADAGDHRRSLPPGVSLADGMTEDEAVAIALWNSPAFAADLTRMQAATANFNEAARIDNPRISVLGPIGPITASASLLAPLMSLFQLPQRTEAAARELESVAESLVQSGLDLIRDVRLAHIERAAAETRLELAKELQMSSDEFAALSRTRSDVGDTSPSDALAADAEAMIAADAVALAATEVTLSAAQLSLLLGYQLGKASAVNSRPLPAQSPSAPDLLRVARKTRPDVRSAELAVTAAATRAGWEKSRIVALSVQADVQWDNTTVAARLGGTVDIPIFNQNQGGVGRAEADIEAARLRLEALRQRVTFEVTRAQVGLARSLVSHRRYVHDITPRLRDALVASKLRYKLGEDSYLVVLNAVRTLGAARQRMAQLDVEVRRAHAELERAVGARLTIAHAGAEVAQ